MSVSMGAVSASASAKASGDLSAWLAKYGPVEREVIEAHERRRVGGRRTTSPCPARGEILEAWMHRRESHEAAARFGSMVHDLECRVDNSLLRGGSGAIVGRRGGVKAWLQVNIPALYVRCTTVMRYKAMARKLMQVTGLSDPVPAAAVLAEPPRGEGRGRAGGRDCGSYEIQAVAAAGAEAGGRIADILMEGRRRDSGQSGRRRGAGR